MNDHMKAAVKTVAKHMSEAALDWTDVESDGHEHDLECTNWGAYTGDALTALEAGLPHLRAMIADDIRTGADPAYDFDFDPQGDYAQGYRQGIRQAAQIAEWRKQ